MIGLMVVFEFGPVARRCCSMNRILILSCLVISGVCVGCGNDASSGDGGFNSSLDTSRTPLEVVNERMGAYNRHDIDAFMENYSDQIEIRTYTGTSLGKGKKHLRGIFAPMFKEGAVQVEIHHQIVKDSFVVNHETVRDGDKETEYVSVYEVRGGLIQSVCFIRD